MESEHTMRMWLALLLGATILIGCGTFFALQNLGNATEYASVASFFLALITAVGSMLTFARSKTGKEHGDHPDNETGSEAHPAPAISNCGVVMTGTRATAKVTINVGHDVTAPAEAKTPRSAAAGSVTARTSAKKKPAAGT